MRTRAALVAVLAGLAVLLAPAAVAHAHAVLEATSPADGAVVATSPPRVTLTFGEDVTVAPSSVRVYDASLREVDRGGAGHVDGDPTTAGVELPPDLPAGTYRVTWRIVSADSHPLQGGFGFSVGHPGPVAVVPDPAAGTGSGLVGVLLGAARFVEYAGLAGVGGALTLAWLRGAGAGSTGRGADDRRARRPVVAGWWLLLVGTVAAVLLQGADAEGLGVLAALDPTVFATTAATPAGVLGLMRVGLLVLLAVAGERLLTAGSPPRVPTVVAAASGLGVVVTFSLGGHAGVGSWAALGVVADAAHVVAMGLWIGGLAVLAAVLAPRRTPDPVAGPIAVVLPRFSRLAQVAVGVVVATGLYQTWRDVAEPGALVGTPYGWLLVAKVAVVVGLVALGDRARRAVARPVLAAPAPTPAVAGTLRRGLLVEVALAVVVLAVTSVLVATPQAAESYAPPVVVTQATDSLVLHARVDAAHTGATTLHLDGTDPAGRPVPLTLVDGAASLPAQQVGPFPLPAAAPGAPAVPVSFAVPGRWALDVTVSAPGTTPTLFRIPVPVR